MRTKNIFIVDDDRFYANIIQTKLESLGHFNIEKYSTGKDCINNSHKQPDIIFLDFYLSDTTGLEVLKDLKSTYPNIHIIMLSGQRELQLAVKTLRYGATDYLIKNSDDNNEKLSQILLDCDILNKMKSKRTKTSVFNFLFFTL